MSDFGGIMRLTIGGAPFVLRGAFKLDPTSQKVETKTNFDLSVARIFTPDAYGAELVLEDTLPSGVTWDQLIQAAPTTIVLIEENTGAIHTFSSAVLEGEISVNREDGEVSGLKLKSQYYQRT